MKNVILKHKRYNHKLNVDVSNEFKLVTFINWLNKNSSSYYIEEMGGDKLVDYKVIDGAVYTNIDSSKAIGVALDFVEIEG